MKVKSLNDTINTTLQKGMSPFRILKKGKYLNLDYFWDFLEATLCVKKTSTEKSFKTLFYATLSSALSKKANNTKK